MDELKPVPNQPDFSCKAGMMKRFFEVPYEQFQKELTDWFYSSLAKEGIDAKQVQQDFPQLPDLVSRIYHQAEISQLLSDNQIDAIHEND